MNRAGDAWGAVVTPEEVRSVVAAEIGNDLAPANSHGINLRTCLVPPRSVSCRNPFPEMDEGQLVSLWVVLEEVPGGRECYWIVFDAGRRAFGLAYHRGGETPVFLGYHGGFLDTLRGM